MSGPSEFQIEVAKLFFSLPASEGFLIAGGGALLANGLTSRPTRDLDFFGVMGLVNVKDAIEQFVEAANNRQWVCIVVQADDSFVRLHVRGIEEVLGPTFNHEELAGRKMLALFDRASACSRSRN